MQSGKLRHKISIEKVNETINDAGEVTESWVEFANIWAQIMPLVGREYWSSRQVESEVTGKIRIRYLPGVTPKMRINSNNRIYNIEAVINIEERNIEMVLLVSEVL